MSEDRKIIEHKVTKYYKERPVYDKKWENNKFVKVQVEHKFVEIEPHLYDFDLSKQLKEKWEHVIDESIPMFFTFDDYEDIDIVVCELEQNYNGKEG
uniref:Phage protein n=1 Tax=Meloidogyne javanica TaxID=6303 RepID=A0A915N830_MELJA